MKRIIEVVFLVAMFMVALSMNKCGDTVVEREYQEYLNFHRNIGP